MAGLLGADLLRGLEPPRRLWLRVGGLPQSPRPPLDYHLVFSVSGLLNEYLEPCRVVSQGKLCLREPLSGLEPIAFDAPFDALEAFHTSGGLSTLADTLLGDVDELDYKTIRSRGHCARLHLLRDLGYFGQEPIQVGGHPVTPRAVTEQLWSQRLSTPAPDIVLLRVVASGTRGGSPVTLGEQLVVFPDDERRLSAMARSTGCPAAVVAVMAVSGQLGGPGARAGERCVPMPLFRAELGRRGLVPRAWPGAGSGRERDRNEAG
jgi:lysine 6-dehydrogenase